MKFFKYTERTLFANAVLFMIEGEQVAASPSGKASVCKTDIQRFDSARRLVHNIAVDFPEI